MNTKLIPLLFLALFGCSEPTPDGIRGHWELYRPELVFMPPLNREVTWSAPPEMVDSLQKAADQWTLHLSCGVNLKYVETGGELQFQCAEPVNTNGYHLEEIGWEEYGLVSIGEKYCERLPIQHAVHAWGHQLGFGEQFKWYPVTMDGIDVNLTKYGNKSRGWRPFETDGFRIWAHQNGAPGCGNRELPWSWQKNPEIYLEHPTRAEANEMLEPL
jgi:hypothetical protein